MSTFLQLAVKLRRECGTAGTGPTTVVGQAGVLDKMVNWIIQSYTDIQLRHPNWRWMRSRFTLPTVASTDTYAYTAATDTRTAATIARFMNWWPRDKIEPFTAYLTSGGVTGQQRLIWMPLEEFNRLYKFGVQQSTTGQPIHVTIDDTEQLIFGPNPNAIYTVSGMFQRSPQVLAADADTPDVPSIYHDLIVFYAMQRYAVNSIAPEVLAVAQQEANRMMRALERAQLPLFRLGSPLC